IDGMAGQLGVIAGNPVGDPVEVLDAANQRRETEDDLISPELDRVHLTDVLVEQSEPRVAVEIVLQVAILREVVDDGHFEVVAQQLADHVRPDEPRSAEREDLPHAASKPIFGSRPCPRRAPASSTRLFTALAPRKATAE